uniref:Mitochondrial import receptor subunit TOM40 n=1 Tax=Angiostrongylus cantonensis TaxID=6313 RepID=A0A0K0DNR0_ANGCA
MSQPTDKSTSVPSKPSTNPGSYEELHRKARDVFPTCFEGAKVMISKGLSSHFQVSHTLSISPTSTGYRFGATYVGTKVVSPQEQYPIFLGDTDVAGNTTATVVHQFGTTAKQASWIRVSSRGRLTTLGLTFANTDLVNESGVVVGQLLRKLTNNLDIGAELLYQYGKQIPGQKLSMLSYSLRYTTPIWTAVATLGSSGAHFTYYHKQTDNLSFGVEFESNTNVGEAVGTFAYQAELPDEGVTMRASVDTNWSVGGVFEKRLSQQLPFTFAMSGLFNHAKV